MTWKIFNTSEDVLVKEFLTNVREDAGKRHCRLLIMGTETPEGYAIRQTCHQPDAVAGHNSHARDSDGGTCGRREDGANPDQNRSNGPEGHGRRTSEEGKAELARGTFTWNIQSNTIKNL